MNMNNFIIRTRKFSKLKIPYLKITSLSPKKELENAKTINPQKINNCNHTKKILNNDSKTNNDRESLYEKEIKNKFDEKLKLASIISNNVAIIPGKYFTHMNGKKLKIMKDNETNTDPIIEEINLSPSDENKNNPDKNLKENKHEEQIKIKNNKIISLKKNIKISSINKVESSDKINEKSKTNNLENNSLINDKKIIISSLLKERNKNVKNEKNKIIANPIIHKEIIQFKKENKESENSKNENNNSINYSLKNKKQNTINNKNYIYYSNKVEKYNKNKMNIKEYYDVSFNNKKNFIKKNRIKNRNIITAINFSKSKDIENKNFSHKFCNSLLNNKYISNDIIINSNSNSQEKINIDFKTNISPLIKSQEIDKNKANKYLSNRIYNLRTKNIRFSPCRYNIFNIAVIENNNSLEETIKQQTVSNFNNKYNFKFKTKNPKEKEKIKNLLDLLKKNHKNLNFQKINDFKKYYSKGRYKFFFEDSKQIERPKTGNTNKLKINKYFSNKKLENYLNQKTNNMISIKTINFLEGTF